MKRIILSAALAAMIAVPAVAQQHERDEMSHEGAAAAFLGQYNHDKMSLHELVSSLTAEQWSFKQAEDRWSIAEIVEHITISEQMALTVLTEQLKEIAVTDEGRETAAGFEQQMAASLSDRSQTFPAPPELAPTGRWAGGEEVMTAFDDMRSKMIEYLEHVDFDMRTRAAPHPVLGMDLDASGWANMAVQHSMRHQQQIQEVMDDEAFPG